jgi:hypothetical protein
MLDLDEFTQRADTALASRTRGELNAVLADLPGLVHREAMVAAAPIPRAPGDRLELRAHGSNLVRGGRWAVPPELLVYTKFGNAKLDFTEAQLASPVVRIELRIKWGGVELVVPEHACVDGNAITEIKWGGLDDKTRFPHQDGLPRFVLTGRVHGGSVTIRNPSRWRRSPQ